MSLDRATPNDTVFSCSAESSSWVVTAPLFGWRRRVKVVHVNPGEPEPEDCDYWWSQEHDRRFFTFIDQYCGGKQPKSLKQLSNAPRVRTCTVIPRWSFSKA